MNFHSRIIIRVPLPAEPLSPADTTAHMTAKDATLESMVELPRELMEFVIPHAVDHTRPAVIAVKRHATAIVPVHFVLNPAKSVAFIQSVAKSVKNLACHALRTVPGPVHIAGNVRCRVQCLVIYCHAQSAAQRC